MEKGLGGNISTHDRLVVGHGNGKKKEKTRNSGAQSRANGFRARETPNAVSYRRAQTDTKPRCSGSKNHQKKKRTCPGAGKVKDGTMRATHKPGQGESCTQKGPKEKNKKRGITPKMGLSEVIQPKRGGSKNLRASILGADFCRDRDALVTGDKKKETEEYRLAWNLGRPTKCFVKKVKKREKEDQLYGRISNEIGQ